VRFVGEARRRATWFGHPAERRLTDERRELLGQCVVTVLDGQVERRLALVVLPVHQRSASAQRSSTHTHVDSDLISALISMSAVLAATL